MLLKVLINGREVDRKENADIEYLRKVMPQLKITAAVLKRDHGMRTVLVTEEDNVTTIVGVWGSPPA